MCRSSRCGLPPRGSFGLCLHHSYIYSPAPLGRPGVPHALQGPEPLPGGAPYYGGGPPGSNSPYPVGHPHQPPGGAPGGLVLRPRAGGQRAWARGPVAQGQLASNPPRRHGRPSPPRQCRHGQGGVRGSCPWATTRHRAHHAAWPTCARFWIYHASARVRAAPFPLRAFTPPRAVLPPSPHPGSARSPSVHGHPNPGAAPGPRPVASRQLADRAGRAPSRASSCPWPPASLPPSLPRTAHPPPPTGQWPPTTRAGVRLCASPRPPHPPAPAPVAAAAALHPTPYTLLTVRRRVERSHQTRTRPITRESSPARESNSARVTHSVGPQRECTVARVRRLLTDSPAPLGHGRCLPTPAGPAPGPGGRPTPRLSGSHHRPPTGQSGPRWRTPCGLPDGHARLPTGREPLGRQPAPRQRAGDEVSPSASANWPARQDMPRNAAGGHRGLPLPPSRPPALPEAMMGRCVCTNLAKDRADAQRLVATRLLDRLHDPLGHFSRLQRIHPRAR